MRVRISLLFPSPNITNFRSGKDFFEKKKKKLAFFPKRIDTSQTFAMKYTSNIKKLVIIFILLF